MERTAMQGSVETGWEMYPRKEWQYAGGFRREKSGGSCAAAEKDQDVAFLGFGGGTGLAKTSTNNTNHFMN